MEKWKKKKEKMLPVKQWKHGGSVYLQNDGFALVCCQ